MRKPFETDSFEVKNRGVANPTGVLVARSIFHAPGDGAYIRLTDQPNGDFYGSAWLTRAEVKRLRRALKAAITKEAGE